MNSRLPMVKVRELVRILIKLGFTNTRQKGSHAFYYHKDGRCTIVPVHTGDIPRGTLKQILKDIHLSDDGFRNML